MLNIEKHLRKARNWWVEFCTGTSTEAVLNEELYRQRFLVMLSATWLLSMLLTSIILYQVVDLTVEGRNAADFIISTSAAGVLLSMAILRWTKNRALALNVILFTTAAEFSLACFNFGGTQSPTYYLLILVPVLAAIAGSVSLAIYWALAMLAFWAAMMTAEMQGVEFIQIIKPENQGMAMFLAHSALAVCILLALIVYAEMNKVLRNDLQRSNTELAYLSQHDQLTKLPNRRVYDERVLLALQRAAERSSMVGLLFIDLNDFKNTNDTYGHGAGDRLLISVATRLQEALRETDLVARIGGDEFAVILEDVGSLEEITHIAQKLSDAVEQPTTVRQHRLEFSASIGIAIFPTDGRQKNELEEQADKAMYYAKKRGIPFALSSLESTSSPYPARVSRET